MRVLNLIWLPILTLQFLLAWCHLLATDVNKIHYKHHEFLPQPNHTRPLTIGRLDIYR